MGNASASTAMRARGSTLGGRKTSGKLSLSMSLIRHAFCVECTTGRMSARSFRISCLADAASPHVQRFAAYCVERGWELEILSFQQAAIPNAVVRELKSGARSIDGSNWHLALHVPRLRRAIRRFRPDLVVAHYITSYGFLAAVSAGSAPIALWGYGSDLLISPSRSWLSRTAVRHALRRCAALLVVSPQLADAATTLWPGVAARTLIVPFGVDPERFHRRDRSEGEPGPRCVALRGFVPNSQPILVLQAFELLASRHPGATLVMTGDGPLRHVLADVIERSRFRDRVRLLGRVDGERVPDLLRAADLYVAPTFSDGTSVSLLEAMACGATPVVSDI